MRFYLVGIKPIFLKATAFVHDDRYVFIIIYRH